MFNETVGDSVKLKRWHVLGDDWFPAVAGFAYGSMLVLAILVVIEPTPAQRAACNRVVQTLLTTHDPIEIQRAGILVRQMNCDIVSRMPPPALP